MNKDLEKELSQLSFEDALYQLEDIVTMLEQAEVPLAEALEIYEKGEFLKKHCANLLKNAEAKISQIKLHNSKQNTNQAVEATQSDFEDSDTDNDL